MADTHFKSGETVYSRFSGEALIVVDCNGCVALVRDEFGGFGGSIVGDLTREAPAGRVIGGAA